MKIRGTDFERLTIHRIAAVTVAMLAIHSHFAELAGASDSFPLVPLDKPSHASPSALVSSPDGKSLYIACATAHQVAVLDADSSRIVSRIEVPDSPLGLALAKDGSRLYVACAAPASTICVIEAASGRILEQFPAGHTALAPVLSPDGRTLYVCNRFDGDVSMMALPGGRELCRIKVQREPIAAALTPDGRRLFVANHLQSGRADGDVVSASISVIDTASRKVAEEIALPNGSGLLREIRISPDGRYACVTHILAKFHFLPRTVHFGWINQNAISLITLQPLGLLGTVVLDELRSGAANPWGTAWTDDGKLLCVTHAGTHELSVIDAPALLDKLRQLPARFGPPIPAQYERFGHYQRPRLGPARSRAEVPNDFGFLGGLRERIALEAQGPRAIALLGRKAYVANYFSDSLSVVDLAEDRPRATSIALSAHAGSSAERDGELWFNDATLCVQGWQSCASCHDADGRMDALNWDLLNDGAQNPKNTRSLLRSHLTPPVMALHVRESAAMAVRAGLHHILFSDPPPEVSAAMDTYLQSLRPVSSPRLVNGRLSAAAERGRQLFESAKTGCAECHPPGLFTDLLAYNVGTAGDYDRPSDRFDTPTLLELWRTAPYLHHGSAATLRELLTNKNTNDRHGRTSHLTDRELDELVEYLMSL